MDVQLFRFHGPITFHFELCADSFIFRMKQSRIGHAEDTITVVLTPPQADEFLTAMDSFTFAAHNEIDLIKPLPGEPTPEIVEYPDPKIIDKTPEPTPF